jgi:hypothetical protein
MFVNLSTTHTAPVAFAASDSRTVGETAPATGVNGSHLDIAEYIFLRTVATNPEITVDGAALGNGLPARVISLGELKSILLHPSTSNGARNAAWRHLAAQARIHGGQWTIGAVGVAMSALRVMSTRLAHQFHAEQAEVDSDLLTGFLEALRTVDLTEPRVITRLCSPAFTATRRALREQLTDRMDALPDDLAFADVPPPADEDEADVLARAVVLGIVSEYEASIIKATRLDGVSLAEFATNCGRQYDAVARSRSRGEKRLVAAIRNGDLSGECDVIAEATGSMAFDIETATYLACTERNSER